MVKSKEWKFLESIFFSNNGKNEITMERREVVFFYFENIVIYYLIPITIMIFKAFLHIDKFDTINYLTLSSSIQDILSYA